LKRKVWRRYGTVLALMGLAFRLLIAAVHVPPAIAAPNPEAASPFSQIILCTASGYRVVQLDENGQPVEPDSSPPLNAGNSCPVCMTLSATPMAPAPTELSLPTPRVVIVTAHRRRSPLVVGHRPLVARGRDPPIQA